LVSNPWREAIEEGGNKRKNQNEMVSNPWREAIEEKSKLPVQTAEDSFQSLEGGY